MKRLLTSLIILSLLVSPMSSANELEISVVTEDDSSTKIEVNGELSVADSEVITTAVQESRLLLKLKQTLAQLQYRYFLLQNNVETAKVNLIEIDETVTYLEEVLTQLELQIEDTEDKILNVKSQKERKKMELEDLQEEAEILELQLEDQKDIVSDLMLIMYVKRDIYFEGEDINAVKVLASPDSVSETLQEITYLDLIEAEQEAQFVRMEELDAELTDKWDDIRVKREELDILDEQLAADLEQYLTEHETQNNVLQETLSERAILEAMLTAADERDEDLLAEIKIYEKNVSEMEEQLSGTRALLGEEEQALISQIEEDMIKQWDVTEIANEVEFEWPVNVGNGLTAYFHDEGYINTFGVDHYAIDIRANHGSSLYAPADGVVYNVVYDPNSSAYAYIMIAHRMGLMTLMGHVSEVAVHSGQYVQQGDFIGLTGGTPGSVGAGYRTTGPHLHLELWKDGVRVDPLSGPYFPLEDIPKQYLPDEYIQELEIQLEDEIKAIQESLGISVEVEE